MGAIPLEDDDYQLQNYQDDLDSDVTIPEPILEEETDDPADDLGLSPEIFGEELEDYDLDDQDLDDEDA